MGRPAVQRALRPLQHLDALEVVEQWRDDTVVLVHASVGTLREIRVVEIDAGRRGAGATDDAANGEGLLRATGILRGRETRNGADEIRTVLDALPIHVVLGYGLDAQRNAIDGLDLASGGNRHFLQNVHALLGDSLRSNRECNGTSQMSHVSGAHARCDEFSDSIHKPPSH